MLLLRVDVLMRFMTCTLSEALVALMSRDSDGSSKMTIIVWEDVLMCKSWYQSHGDTAVSDIVNDTTEAQYCSLLTARVPLGDDGRNLTWSVP